MILMITQEQWDDAVGIGTAKYEESRLHGRRHRPDTGDPDVMKERGILGVRGEFALNNNLKGTLNHGPGPDHGYDITVGQIRHGVQTAGRLVNCQNLLIPLGKKVDCEILHQLVQVDTLMFDHLGWLSMDEWIAMRRVDDFGYGDCWYVAVKDLKRLSELEAWVEKNTCYGPAGERGA